MRINTIKSAIKTRAMNTNPKFLTKLADLKPLLANLESTEESTSAFKFIILSRILSVGIMLKVAISMIKFMKNSAFVGKKVFRSGILTIIYRVFIIPHNNYIETDL